MDPLLRLLRYARPHRLVIGGALAAMLLYGAASAALAWLVKPILDSVLPARESLGFVATALLVVYVAKGLGSFLSSYWMDDLGHRVVMALRTELFEHVLGQSAAFFARRSTGQLLSRVNNDVGQVQRAVSETIGDLARETLTVFGYAGLLIYLDGGLPWCASPRRRSWSTRCRVWASACALCRAAVRRRSSACRTWPARPSRATAS